MIEIKNVSKIYEAKHNEGNVLALTNINSKIMDGEFVGIVGESGGGKSTLLNIIGVLDKPTKGIIEIDGENVGEYNDNQSANFRKNKLGFIFQDFYLDEDLTVLQNVEMPLIIKGEDRKSRQELAKQILIKLGLQDKIYKTIDELSGGQKQRVCIARALVGNASLILADEPTGNLDTNNGLMIVNLLKELAKEGKTVILVTHNMHEASFCDRLIKLQDGRVVD